MALGNKVGPQLTRRQERLYLWASARRHIVYSSSCNAIQVSAIGPQLPALLTAAFGPQCMPVLQSHTTGSDSRLGVWRIYSAMSQ